MPCVIYGENHGYLAHTLMGEAGAQWIIREANERQRASYVECLLSKFFCRATLSYAKFLSEQWDEAYRTGQYRNWDFGAASQEVATIAAFGLFPRNGTILDAGCGSGSDAVFLATLGFRVKALDASSVALDLVKGKAAKAGVRVEAIHADATKMPIDDASIDFALDRGLLHNLNDNDGVAYGRELARVLKQGAGLLLRGARISYNGNFNPITVERLRATFTESQFSIGPLIPITMVSGADKDPTLDGVIVRIQRR
ncbi:MAG: class I SAM-dependent methyltransferase [Nitrososphaerota archaeon]|nr:class I SAM-dependent methyltransferase [Nitrososphaerota archaeon]